MESNNLHLETIENVKRYIDKEDYTGLEEYIIQRENYVKKHIEMSKDKSADYIDTLIEDLK